MIAGDRQTKLAPIVAIVAPSSALTHHKHPVVKKTRQLLLRTALLGARVTVIPAEPPPTVAILNIGRFADPINPPPKVAMAPSQQPLQYGLNENLTAKQKRDAMIKDKLANEKGPPKRTGDRL